MSNVDRCLRIHWAMEDLMSTRLRLPGKSKVQFHRLEHLPMIYFLPADRIQINQDKAFSATDQAIRLEMAKAMAGLAAYRQYEKTLLEWTTASVPALAARPVRIQERSPKWEAFFDRLRSVA